jgi:hypothetical protein
MSSLAMNSCVQTLPMLCILQLCRALGIARSLMSTTLQASALGMTRSKACLTTSSNPSRQTQNASKRNLGFAHGSE